ncbi:MAG: hypothetical protein ACMUIP_07940 [bacterium]
MRKRKGGKILRIKRGYNPNSSSIGSIVFAIPTMLLVSSALFGAATPIIFSKILKKTADTTKKDNGTNAQEPAA